MDNLFDELKLLTAPIRRAAYSDRTSWLMAAMAELAYFKFEGDDFEDLALELARLSDTKRIQERLQMFLRTVYDENSGDTETLRNALALANFELINTYNKKETQAFLAKRADPSNPMLVLAFRGTEMNSADIKADLRANLISADGAEKVHKGFKNAFEAVRQCISADLKKCPNIPIYLTGHSLGGALAVIAARYLASDSLGACYTFGSPRVGNLEFSKKIKTPIYRVINSADIVPRLPPAFLINLLSALSRWIPLPLDWLVKFLRSFRGYIHYGDMRYLTHVAEGSSDYPKLELIPNLSFPSRLSRLVGRWIRTFGKAAAQDHSIALYRKKLRAYALKRITD